MSKTTIQITKEQKEQLDNHKNPSEPYRVAIDRLLGNTDGILTEEEVRSLTREEVKKVISERS